MTDLVIVPFGAEFLAFSPEELAQARDRAREILGVGPLAAATTQSSEQLLTAQQMEAATQIPSGWFLESARRRSIPFVRLGRYPRFLLSKLIEHGAVTLSTGPGGEWTRRQKGKRAAEGTL